MRIYWSKKYNPNSWDDDSEKIIKFPFNIEKFLYWILRLMGKYKCK